MLTRTQLELNGALRYSIYSYSFIHVHHIPSHHITSHHIPRVRYIRCIVRSAERVFQLSTNDDKKKETKRILLLFYTRSTQFSTTHNNDHPTSPRWVLCDVMLW
mmetsp:Transcript_2082/g.2274  ORF Transcript_2082/g.2274 Transcript_2082/m.2274 type:complete len:104 (-) Transcript_2082:90-401(-)